MRLGEDTGLAELGGTIRCEVTRHWNVLAAKSSHDSAIVNMTESSMEITAAEDRVAGGGAVIGTMTGRARSAVDFIEETGLD